RRSLQSNRRVEREISSQAAAVWVEQEQVAAAAQDRRGAVDLADRGLAKNGPRVPEVLLVLPRPRDPVAEPLPIAVGKVTVLVEIACWDHVDDVVPTGNRDRRQEGIAPAEIVPVARANRREHHAAIARRSWCRDSAETCDRTHTRRCLFAREMQLTTR